MKKKLENIEDQKGKKSYLEPKSQNQEAAILVKVSLCFFFSFLKIQVTSRFEIVHEYRKI